MDYNDEVIIQDEEYRFNEERRLEDEAIWLSELRAEEDMKQASKMRINIRQYIDRFLLNVKVRVLTTGNPPIDSITGNQVDFIDLHNLYKMIRAGTLTSNGEIIPRLFCKLVLKNEVLQWSTIFRSVINHYISNGISYDMLSDIPDDFNMPTIYLIFGIIDETTLCDVDMSYIYTPINYNILFHFVHNHNIHDRCTVVN